MVLQLIFFGLCVHFSRRALMEDYSVTREENKSCVFCCQSRTVIPGVEAKTSMMLHTHVVLFTAVVNYLRPPTQAVSPHAHLPCCFCASTWWRWETVEGKRHMFQILFSVENVQTWKLMNNSARHTLRFTWGAWGAKFHFRQLRDLFGFKCLHLSTWTNKHVMDFRFHFYGNSVTAIRRSLLRVCVCVRVVTSGFMWMSGFTGGHV